LDECNEEIQTLVRLVRGKLTSLERKSIGALIVINVHGINIVESLIDVKINTTNDFDWEKELRYYWD